jgi:hypothetical protein
MIAHSVVAAVSNRRRRSEIDATIYVALYKWLAKKRLALSVTARQVPPRLQMAG